MDPAQAKLEYERAGGYVLFTLVYNIAYSPSSSECTAPLPEQVEYYFHRDDHAASNRHKLCRVPFIVTLYSTYPRALTFQI